ncbi:MAG: transcription elongation factor GreA [Candidatus Kerfeldbacteria bacterium CG08_land_8_20_14_0_20_42_7]|uniref:Transcription elongation factor GreA n=1 Tax=Candidatus Kerfeldbacteria bacterium CG08_land_8_20_14_0_20_42_7 TaxID=2014245 RepID=A0A2H0YTF9_9BACT|nr:MAG: transcription elongation factor GreA [Candidatus Kerfeldbacteria bacterium CG08_land_8_20_14_0_20_42_7]
MIQETVLTPEGHKKLLQELEVLRQKRKIISDRIEEAKELGDLSENAEYHEAKNDQAFTEGRIIEVESLLNNARVVNKSSKNHDIVQLGSTVIVSQNGKKLTYDIVGINEADPVDGKISNESPLGGMFLGKRKGDVVEVNTPKGLQAFKIEDIS